MKNALTFLLLLALLSPHDTGPLLAQQPPALPPEGAVPVDPAPVQPPADDILFTGIPQTPPPVEPDPLDDIGILSPEDLEMLESMEDFFFDPPSRFREPETSLLGIGPTTRCHEVIYRPGDIILLSVAPFADLRIEMPLPVVTLKLGGGNFWEATHAEGTRHIWTKTASLLPEAAETSLTILDENLAAYDIILQRQDIPGYTCAIIALDPALTFTRDLRDAASSPSRDAMPPDVQQQFEALQAEIAGMRLEQANSLAAAQQAAVNRINEIHSQIYAGYAWGPETDDEISARIAESILSVHDDGVRTFIRVADLPSIGLIAIQGQYGGETQLVQTAYDPLLSMYTVTGIYDRLLLSGGAEDARAVVRRIQP